MNEVELVNISHSYGNHAALRNISVAFREGKATVIIGRSGSGKSTLLKTINGLVKPQSGKVIAPDRKQIGYVVQGNGLFPHLTVAANISMHATLSGEKNTGPRTLELLQLTDLPASYLKKYPHELSGGEQQRVALCRALYSKPPVLLMDEPFGALDPVTRRGINEKIIALRKITDITMIIVTHDVAEARRLADDLLVLDHGAVQQFDSKDNVFQSPANPAVAELLFV